MTESDEQLRLLRECTAFHGKVMCHRTGQTVRVTVAGPFVMFDGQSVDYRVASEWLQEAVVAPWQPTGAFL